MKNKAQLEALNTASEAELPRVLGEILQPETDRHISEQTLEEMQFSYYHCKKCGQVNFEPDSHCDEITLIDIYDWPTAMKFRNEAVEKWGEETYAAQLIRALMLEFVYGQISTDKQIAVALSTKTKPKHHYIAAARCELMEGA